ncbi:hypothetical protein D8M15_07430 [Micrococcus sp. HSID17228]|uniref:hypothetical protein n=1 Tax=Micrococcus TaxID=1269 RepID=UPI000F91D4E1|nr:MULTISPECIES: hypothetical protein [unclassified Micrococcus]RUQ41124.1 hypothetical protein D8M29_09040 [Micrococcus sp. HSID17227]RUQ44447.1 hypothetical protein D8M15_07430 [Micrococcus sp. HSID17228]
MAKNSTIGRYASGKVKDFGLKSALDENGEPTEGFEKALSTVLAVQRPLVLKNIQRMAAKHPGESPERLAERLGQQYLTTVTGAGAAVGGTAIVPGIGTVAALGLSGAAVVGFLEATALYAQSLAELHGITTQDPQRAQALVMALMLGDDAKELLREAAAKAGRPYDPQSSLNALAGTASGTGISAFVVNRLKRTFMRKMLLRQGAGFVGRAVPFGVGAVIGGVGNRAMGKAVMENAKELFGPLPMVIPGEIREGAARERAEGEPEGTKDDGGVLGAIRRALPGGKDEKDNRQKKGNPAA